MDNYVDKVLIKIDCVQDQQSAKLYKKITMQKERVNENEKNQQKIVNYCLKLS